ncbi:hypothetical protein E4U27_002466 [Claviceps purpurea]|nr:hypothetical protein E4U27_002466 [Claviceps purpurea]KAG6231473.1 hypothetical protein E4U26_006806 [Claviceps purpurea]KAG6302864.1 hypothetical protein E4U45_002543 [Claviceps purpurea]
MRSVINWEIWSAEYEQVAQDAEDCGVNDLKDLQSVMRDFMTAVKKESAPNNLTPSLRYVSQKFGDVAVLPAETNANRSQTRHLDEIFTRIDMRYLSGVHCDVDGNMVEVPPQWGHDDDTT